MPERDRYAAGTPNWVDLATPDPDAAKAFYTAVLGWDWTDEPTDGPEPHHMARLRGLPVAGMLRQSPQNVERGVPPAWNTYLAVDDVAAVAGKAEAAGATLMVPPTDIMRHGRMAFIVDPTGAAVGLWEAREHVGARIVDEPGVLCWAECETPDPAAATAFYTGLLGYRAETAPMDGQDYTILMVGDDGVAGVMELPDPEVPPSWFVTFAVADADAAVERIQAAGGTVMGEPMDIVPGRLVILADPFGAVLSVLQRNDL